MKISDLKRKNFGELELVKSETADREGIDNIPRELATLENLNFLADKMQKLRDIINLPIIPTSGYRCQALNKKVGGSPTSRHMVGLACDFNVKGLNPNDAVLLIYKKVKEHNFSIDKCFIERGCVHIQFKRNESRNANYFAYAERINGKWITTPIIL